MSLRRNCPVYVLRTIQVVAVNANMPLKVESERSGTSSKVKNWSIPIQYDNNFFCKRMMCSRLGCHRIVKEIKRFNQTLASTVYYPQSNISFFFVVFIFPNLKWNLHCQHPAERRVVYMYNCNQFSNKVSPT